MQQSETHRQGSMPRKRKHSEDQQEDSHAQPQTEDQESALSAENKQLRAEVKLLKDWLTDVRNSVNIRDKLIDTLERSLDMANKEIELLRESEAKQKVPKDTRSLNEQLQNHFLTKPMPASTRTLVPSLNEHDFECDLNFTERLNQNHSWCQPCRMPPPTIMDIQRLGQDIRDKLDLSRNRREICRILQLQRPPRLILLDNPNAYDTHGLDCLLALVRHIYSQLLPVYFDKDKHKDAEEKNPVLSLAWLDINFEAKDDWEACKQNILKSFNPSHAQDPAISFEGLVNSRLMKDTFWSHEAHMLYRACLVKPAEGPWDHADLGPNPDAVRVDMSNIVVDRNKAPWWTFKQHMRSHFQLTTTDDTTELNMCAEPCIIRVHYKTNKNLEPFPFSTIKNTYIPIAEVKGSEPIPNARDCLYTLIASVSLHDNDIRTYAFLGEHIMPQPRHSSPEKPWSLEDKVDGDFMLFYGRAGNAMPDFGVTEVVRLPRENPHLAFVNNALQRDINKRREAQRAQREKEEREQQQDN